MPDFDRHASDYDPRSGRLRVAVLASPAGECAPVEAAVPRLDAAGLTAADRAALAAAAAEFTAAVLSPALWTLWRESVGRAGAAPLRLRVVTAGAAAALPWELLADLERGYFLALDPASPVVRYLPGPIPHAAAPGPPPLRLLLAGASSSDLPPLPIAQELDAIQSQLTALGPAAAVHRVDHLTGRGLQAALLSTSWVPPNPSSAILGSAPHVFHFAGHGGWDAASAAGMLALEGEDGASDPLDAELLATLLRGRGVRLAVLNACGSAAAPVEWASLAHSLVRAGVPMVVAMAGAIPNRLAAAFAGSLYAALAAGLPAEAAATHGRQTLAWLGPGEGLAGAWLLPLLFSRAADGRLVQAPAASQSAATADSPAGGGVSIGTVNARYFLAQGEMTVIEPGAHVHYGDEVGGDQIQVGDVAGDGIAIGRGASAVAGGGMPPETRTGPSPALRGLLVRLYGEEAGIRRVAGDAGLDLSRIDFHSSAVDQWQRVLAEAERSGALRAVVDIACQEYPRRADELRAMYAALAGH